MARVRSPMSACCRRRRAALLGCGAELIAALARQQVRADRRADIELVFTEAANNAVEHAYRHRGPGPLYVAASLAGDTVVIRVSDGGRAMRPGSGSPGAGFGVPLMAQLADYLRICSDADRGGTCVQATFQRAAPPGMRAAAAHEPERAELLEEYLRVLGEVSASLRDDSQAILAEAKQAVAHARQRHHERAKQRQAGSALSERPTRPRRALR
jgi:anti-sigma regulatory factor (Ser/Thr protein kinase)